MLYAWSKFGITAAADHFFKSHDYKERLPANPSKLFKRVVKGKIDYLGMVADRKVAHIYLSWRNTLHWIRSIGGPQRCLHEN
jgi:hypothetical protein